MKISHKGTDPKKYYHMRATEEETSRQNETMN